MSLTANIPRTLFAASALALIMIALGPGCGPSESAELGEAPSAISNPASDYCAKQGYRWETRTEPRGDYGVCRFPDGSSCEEWDFYKANCGKRFSYCNRHGGRITH